MVLTVRPSYLRWQAKSIPAWSEFRGVMFLGLLVAWAFFLWVVMALPPFADVASGFGPLLHSALDKGRFMPDFAAIIAGFLAFHFRREFQTELKGAVAVTVVVMVIGSLLVPLVVAILVQNGVRLAAGQAIVVPWQDALMHIQFRVVLILAILTILLPFGVFLMWTGTPDIGWAGVVLAATFYGMTFYLHSYRLEWMWPPRVLGDVVMGLALSSTLFRAAEYVVAVRGTTIIIGTMGLIGGSILAGPGMFFFGFLMVLGGLCLEERRSTLRPERVLLRWSRTAYAVALAQPIVLTAWLAWGGAWGLSRPVLFVLLAVATQLLAVLLHNLVSRPVRVALRRLVPAPIK